MKSNAIALHAISGISDSKALVRYLDAHQHPVHILLGEHLLRAGYVTEDVLNEALYTQRQNPGRRLGEILVEVGAIDRALLTRSLHELMGIPHVNLHNFDFDAAAVNMLPGEMARRHQVIPLMLFRDELVVAAAEIPDHKTLELLAFTVNRTIFVVISEVGEIIRAIDVHYSNLEESLLGTDLTPEEIPAPDAASAQDEEFLAKQQPIVRLVNSIIFDGIVRRASDIHLRPGAREFELLYRVDGTLIPARKINRQLLPAVVSRIKIIAGLNIAEHRVPQDGHLRVTEKGNGIDLRVSVIPTQHGESVVIRILNKNAGMREIHEIGFTAQDEAVFRDLISRSSGILLVTGPTGSGKTTTLYAALQEVKKEMVNVVTVEDPIEYQLDGMRQIQLQESIGFGFAQTLRHILRHDPDVIMVGEIRDTETAKVALESALTGHLVFSTLHTNDAPGAIIRLQEMGMSPYLIKSALIGVIGQRLIRLNCPHCKAVEEVSPVVRRNLHLADGEVFYRSTGCEHCQFSGFAGRAAIYEMFVVNHAVQAAIHDNMTGAELREIAIQSGMRPLVEHGLEYARSGKASLTEVYRAAM